MTVDPIAEYQQSDSGGIRCGLCPHHCLIREGQCGRCHVRCVRDGELKALSYGRISSLQIDPVEKKPLYHYYPGDNILSVGGWGCNFACDFCQNWSISQSLDDRGERAQPEAVLAAVRRARVQQVAYTYNEPLVNYEFVRDCSRLMREHGFRNVLVTNGFIETEPAEALLALTDALNVDIKSMDDDFYRRRCHGRLEPVLQFTRLARAAGCHLEITHLLVPEDETVADKVTRLADWIAANLGPETPLHISAYHPRYRSQTPATQPDQLRTAYAAAAEHLQFVYLGNVASKTGRDTVCPRCGYLWVRRGEGGYGSVNVTGVADAVCCGCGAAAALRY